MRNGYKAAKIFFIIMDVSLWLVCAVFCIAIVSGLGSANIAEFISVFALFFVFLFTVQFFLLRYYSKLVISISFDNNENAVIKTAKSEFKIPCASFTRVYDEGFPLESRTYLFYTDENSREKKLIYVLRPFLKKYPLDKVELRKHMLFARVE